MKKSVIIIFLIFAGLSVFAQSGVIKELSGTVELKGSASSDFVPAKNGDQVREDTVISTGFKSNALVEVGSTLITVRPLTRLTLTEIRASAGSESLNVNLQSGRIRVDLNPPSGTKASMAVVGPQATASVRGTSFEFDTRSLQVYDGAVSFKGSRGRAILIDAGASISIGANDKVVNPVSFGTSALKPHTPVGSQPNTAPVTVYPSKQPLLLAS